MLPPAKAASLLSLLLLTLPHSTLAAVLGLDAGQQNIKATLVKPGIPLEIVLTKDSKRKEAAAVAFKPTLSSDRKSILTGAGQFPERAYGPDALALQGRMPGEVFAGLKPLLGADLQEVGKDWVMDSYKAKYPAVQVEQVNELGTTVFKSTAFEDSEVPWSVEELMAMEFASIKRNAETMAGKGSGVEDVVLTIPPFYTAMEKRSLLRAADLAGLNVMGLVSDGLAVGLDYAKTRTFPDVSKDGKPEHHLVLDMGAGTTTATLLRFQGKTVKDIGRFNKTVQEVTVLSTGWDRTLGGDALNEIIVKDYVHKFLTKPVMKSRGIQADEIEKNGRIMSRLWKEAEKSRLTLSANTETISTFEELLPEIDFKTKLSRTEFERLTEDFAARVAVPINVALAMSKMDYKDLDSVILHGGLIRTPFIQRKLEALVKDPQKLKSNVNADESAVFGAALKAAALSPSFKVKEIRDSDVAGYASGMYFPDGDREKRQGLFTPQSPVGHGAVTKAVSFNNKEDFEFHLYQQIGSADQGIATISTTNLTESVKALKDKFGCEAADVSTKFEARLSPLDGLPEIVSAAVSCNTSAVIPKAGSIGDSVKDFLGFGKKKDQEPLADGEAAEPGPTEDVEASSTTSSSTSGSASPSAYKVPEKPKKRIETINIAFTVISRGLPQPSAEETLRMKTRLAAFDASDRARLAREEALNVLEAYTYYVRDFFDNTDYSSVSTAAQRDAVSSLLATTRTWMEDGAEVAKSTEKTLKEKLSGLKKLVEPIQARRKEGEARPEKVKAFKETLEKTDSLMTMVKEQVKDVAKAKSEWAELQSSSSASAAEAAASASATPAADTDAEPVGEDAEATTFSSTSTSSATAEMPKPTTYSFTPEDLTLISGVYEDVNTWFTSQEAAQNKLSAHEDPVLLTSDLQAKEARLQDVMQQLVAKKLRFANEYAGGQDRSASSSKKSKTSSKSKTSKSSKTKKSKGKGSETASGNGGSVTPEASKAAEKGKKGPTFITMGADGQMPTEEEILKAVRENGAEDGEGEEAGEKGHDEL
ncbi:hypothetical protein B0A48_09961 [Cryoendolithus antarcticus]|uniref:Actin-like ATPase domain-containing protein n=1 Tax=Cryoendolithus antarcticus TaxID=1507870 RepID=A0A1V8T379_9PEZI|nr:hypothetical protein B0A48_09961 [Cryoendolithus antarcticus]